MRGSPKPLGASRRIGKSGRCRHCHYSGPRGAVRKLHREAILARDKGPRVPGRLVLPHLFDSPSADLDACGAFALRLRRAIETIVMTYKEHRIRVSLTVGLASAHGDASVSLEHLLQTAAQRVADGRKLGGNRVVSESGEVTADTVGRFSRLAVSVDHALTQIRTGSGEEARKRLRELTNTLLPLLEMIESEYHVGIPLAELAEKAQITNIDMNAQAMTTVGSRTVWRTGA